MLPEPREDGICCECLGKPAVTTDGRWCLKCLKKKIREDNPYVGGPSDQFGRHARDSRTLGGAPDMRTTEEIDD